MPYTGPGDATLPDNIKDLPENRRAQWVEVFNSVFADCQEEGGEDCESVAFRQANGTLAANSLQFTVNQVASTRNETMDGTKFLVAPVVAIRAGELNGETVTVDEIAAHFAQWNGTPFVVGHPKVEGESVSANDPEILAAQQIGRLFNVTMEGDKLKGEIWVNLAQAAKVARGMEVVNRLQNGKLEVSTAYFRDRVNGAARNIRNDHLAALLDEKGACSWADGCGAPRVNAKEKIVEPEKEVLSILQRIEQRIERIFKTNQDEEKNRMNELIEQLLAAEGMTLNAEQLGAMDEDALKALGAMVLKAVAKEVTPEPAAEPAAEPATNATEPVTPTEPAPVVDPVTAPAVEPVVPAPVTNAQPCAQTETLMTFARELEKRGDVASIFETIDKARQQTAETHAGLVAQLVANAQCVMTQEQLAPLPLDALQSLAHSFRPADYSGQGAGTPAATGYAEYVM